MAWAMCAHNPERVPGIRPGRRPLARLKSWHGNPPQIMSTGGTRSQSMVVMSPRFGIPGQWWAKTRPTGSLFSLNQMVRAPNTASTAKSRPRTH
jgi:hypothetical protein